MAAAEGGCAAAPSSGTRKGGAEDVGVTGGDRKAAPTLGTRTGGGKRLDYGKWQSLGGVVDVATMDSNCITAPLSRTRTAEL